MTVVNYYLQEDSQPLSIIMVLLLDKQPPQFPSLMAFIVELIRDHLITHLWPL